MVQKGRFIRVRTRDMLGTTINVIRLFPGLSLRNGWPTSAGQDPSSPRTRTKNLGPDPRLASCEEESEAVVQAVPGRGVWSAPAKDLYERP